MTWDFAGGWNSALSRAAIEGISTTCKDLRSLSLTGCKGLMGDSLLTVVQSCQVLEKLDLSAVSVFSAHSIQSQSATFNIHFLV